MVDRRSRTNVAVERSLHAHGIRRGPPSAVTPRGAPIGVGDGLSRSGVNVSCRWSVWRGRGPAGSRSLDDDPVRRREVAFEEVTVVLGIEHRPFDVLAGEPVDHLQRVP
jgi:hypothetical protein